MGIVSISIEPVRSNVMQQYEDMILDATLKINSSTPRVKGTLGVATLSLLTPNLSLKTEKMHKLCRSTVKVGGGRISLTVCTHLEGGLPSSAAESRRS